MGSNGSVLKTRGLQSMGRNGSVLMTHGLQSMGRNGSVLMTHGLQSIGSNGSVLKGHGFQPCRNPRKNTAALAAEGRFPPLCRNLLQSARQAAWILDLIPAEFPV